MAKFIFKMQSILNLKERIEDQKEQEFAKALQILASARQILENLTNEKHHTIAKLRGEMGIKISPLDFQAYNNYIEVLKQRIEQQLLAIREAEAFVEKKRLELVEATKERKMLDKLKENKREEFIEEEKHSEQKQVDEIVSYKYAPSRA